MSAGDCWDGYESGPFCRHWSDPADCEDLCALCSHPCGQHEDDVCDTDGCDCRQWVNPGYLPHSGKSCALHGMSQEYVDRCPACEARGAEVGFVIDPTKLDMFPGLDR